MNKNNILKVVVAIIVVLALVLPSSAMFANFEETMNNNISSSDVDNNIDLTIDDSLQTLDGATIGNTESVDWWPMHQHDLNRTGYSTSTVPTIVTEYWSFNVGQRGFSSPAVVDGRVFVGFMFGWMGSEYGIFYCLDESDGSVIWNYTTGDWIESSPTVADGKVYFGTNVKDGNLYCLNASDGSLIWKYDANSNVESSPAVVDGKVFFGTTSCPVPDKGQLYCLNALNGSLIWQYSTTGCDAMLSPAVADGKVYVGSQNQIPQSGGNIYCLYASNGSLIWKYAGSDNMASRTSPAVYDGKVYCTSNNRDIPYGYYVYCLNARNGSLIWNHTLHHDILASPAIANGKVFISTLSGQTHCLNAQNGSLIWEFDDPPQQGSSSSCAVADGKVLVGYNIGMLFCLDESDGSVIWSYTVDEAGNRKFRSPVIANGKVYFTCYEYYSKSAFLRCLGVWDHDVGVNSINSPVSENTTVFTPEVTVKNFGLNNETDVQVNMQIDKITYGDPWTEILYSGTGHWEQRDYANGTVHLRGTGLYFAQARCHEHPYLYDVGLFTPPLDLSGLSSVTLEFEMLFYQSGDDIGKVNVYSGGFLEETLSTYTSTIQHGLHETLTFDPSGYHNPSEVYIEFYFYSDGGWGWSIDDVCISEIGLLEGFEGDIFPPLMIMAYVPEYNETVNIDINRNESKTVTFPEWMSGGGDGYLVTACVQLINDVKPDNDCVTVPIMLDYGHDVGVREIAEPSGSRDEWLPGTYPVESVVRNYGFNFNESRFNVNAKIWFVTEGSQTPFYEDDFVITITMEPRDEVNAVFSHVTFEDIDEGDYRLEVTTELDGDDNPFNDQAIMEFAISPDITPPVTTCTLLGTMGENGWYVSDVTIILEATDDLSGVDIIYYRIDGGNWLEYSCPMVTSTDGVYVLEYYSVDNAGNIEEVKGPFHFKIDQTPPTIELTWDEENSKLVADVDDETSGVAKVEFYVNGGHLGDATEYPYEWTVPNPKTGDMGRAIVYDNAGNSASRDAVSQSHSLSSNTGYPVIGDEIYSSPAVADGKVFIGSTDLNLYCLDEADGSLVWKYTTGDEIYSSPAVADGKVFIGSRDGNIYCFGPLEHDIEVTSIDSPVSGPATVFTPEVTVRNVGLNHETNVPVNIVIAKVDPPNLIIEHNETVYISNINVGESKVVAFPDWPPEDLQPSTPSGSIRYMVTACIQLINDEEPSNDCKTEMVILDYIHDVAVKEITEPSEPSGRFFEGEWIHFDDGICFTGIGLTASGTYEAAIRITPDELEDYNLWQLTVVKFYHYTTMFNPGATHSGKIKIYEEGTSTTPGALITSEPYTVTGEGWFEIELSDIVLLDADEDVWVSVEVTHFAGEYPIGVDVGPAVDGKGDWIYIESYDWGELQSYGLDYNWNIWAEVEEVGSWPPGTLPVEAVVRNCGVFTESHFTVNATIFKVADNDVFYQDSIMVTTMNASDEITVAFDNVTFEVTDGGRYRLKITTELVGDANPINNHKLKILDIIDAIPPTITLEKQWLGLKTKFTASVIDPLPSSGIDRVEFYLDDVLQKTFVEDTFVTEGVYKWNYTGLETLTVTAIVYDNAGNSNTTELSTPYSYDMDDQSSSSSQVIQERVIYNYTFVATDPNDDVTFCIDWGDGTGQVCYGPFASGEEIEMSHTWDKEGTYGIKAKAADIHGAKIGWTTYDVIMPLNKYSSYSNTMDDQILLSPVSLVIDNPIMKHDRPSMANHDDVILSENFDGNWTDDPDGDPYMVPEGWDIDGICIGTQERYPELTHYWSQFDDDDSQYWLTHSPPYCAGLWWSDGYNESHGRSQDEWLITPELDVSGYTNLQLEFYSVYTMKNFGPSLDAHDYVKVSTDGGITWNIIGDLCHDVEFYFPDVQGEWNWNEIPVVINLSMYDGCSSLMVAFNYENNGHGGYGIWMVDDIVLTGEVCYTKIEISGGLGVNVIIKNTGEENITGLEYSIALDGGLIILPAGGSISGTVDIPADDEVSVKAMVLGLGKTVITVTAGCVEETTNGLVFLIFVLGG